MKKLILFVIVAFATIAVNAASYNWVWGINDVSLKDYTGTTLTENVAITLYVEGITSSYASVMTNSSGSFSAVSFTTTDLLEGDYNWYFTYVDEANQMMFTSASLTVPTPELGEGFISFSGRKINQGTWSSVPEPTSGLLLLCGLAGLALRRKKA